MESEGIGDGAADAAEAKRLLVLRNPQGQNR